MGTLKIELDLPEFKDQVEVSIVVRKDGTLVVPPSIIKDKSPNPERYIENKPLIIRDPVPGEKGFMEVKDPVINPYEVTCGKTNSPQVDTTANTGLVDSMINGKW